VDIGPREHRPFLVRVLRIVAILCLCFGIYQAINVGIFVSRERLSFGYFGNGRWATFIHRGLQFAHFASAIVLAIGGVGLMRWKRWARPVLMIWAWLQVGVYAGSNLAYTASYLKYWRSTTQPSGDPLWFYLWMFTSQIVQHSMFPLLVFFVLIHREVGALWAKPQRGFEVLPVETVE